MGDLGEEGRQRTEESGKSKTSRVVQEHLH
jgi:hypothetical protein